MFLIEEEGALYRISRKVQFRNPGAGLLRALWRYRTSQQTSQTYAIEPTSASSGPRVEESVWLGRMPADKEQDLGRIGAATGSEVSQLTRTGAVGSSSDLVAHLHMLLRSSQRPGHLIYCREKSGFSAGLRGANAGPAAVVESDKIVDESSRVLSQRVGADDRRVYSITVP